MGPFRSYLCGTFGVFLAILAVWLIPLVGMELQLCRVATERRELRLQLPGQTETIINRKQ